MDLSRRQALAGLGAGVAVNLLGDPPRPALARPAGPADRTAGRPADLTAAPGAPGAPGVDQALTIINFDLVEQAAKQAMSPGGYAYVAGGVGDEETLRANVAAFPQVRVLPKRLAGLTLESIDTTLTLLGHHLAYPILVTPMGAQSFAHPQADLASAAGAGAAGALYIASTASSQPMEAIAKATNGPKWFQLYFNDDLDVTRSLLQRAHRAGYSAVVFTVDSLGPGSSDGYKRLGSPKPPMGTANFDPKYGGIGAMGTKVSTKYSDVAWVRDTSGLPVIVKGVLRGDDAVAAVNAGAVAVQVSNHGGRVYDGVPASLTVLPEVVRAVGGRVPIIFDSGIRRGVDVFRALALGATAVAVGRPIWYSMAVGGPSGVRSALEFLRDELRTAMHDAGAAKLADITPQLLAAARADV